MQQKILTRSRLIGISICLFWLSMIGLLMMRQNRGIDLGPGPLGTAQAQNRPSFNALSISTSTGQRVGTMRVFQVAEERDGRDGYRFGLNADLALDILDSVSNLAISGAVWQPATQEPNRPNAEFEFQVDASGQKFELSGTVDQQGLQGTVSTGGEVGIPLEFPIDGRALFASGFGSPLRFPVLEVGERYRFDSFDPITLSSSEADVLVTAAEDLDIGGRAVPSRRLEITTSGIQTTAWVDLTGEVLRAETPFGLVLERLIGSPVSASDRSLEPSTSTGPADPGDFLALTAIVPTGTRPFRGAQEMVMTLGGLDHPTSLLEPISSPAQAVLPRGQVKLVASPPGSSESSAPDELQRFLISDVFVQANHEAIRARAREITESAMHDWDKAKALHAWVFTSVEKVPILGIPSALEVLRDLRGDCNEHTVLFTALARAAELPTKIAIGVVWSDQLEAFYYHAWPEVFITAGDEEETGNWVAMDPTLDQEVADATHLKLLNGGIETWPRLLHYLGRLEIAVDSVQ